MALTTSNLLTEVLECLATLENLSTLAGKLPQRSKTDVTDVLVPKCSANREYDDNKRIPDLAISSRVDCKDQKRAVATYK
ncbi:hypothetical protein QE152_g25639 [Popillia japonica]|uniref:Uncharacterized protein n=1 Tax=Popillia japonica TaxID=7064 RepID=A0AAW1K0D8_POPJA